MRRRSSSTAGAPKCGAACASAQNSSTLSASECRSAGVSSGRRRTIQRAGGHPEPRFVDASLCRGPADRWTRARSERPSSPGRWHPAGRLPPPSHDHPAEIPQYYESAPYDPTGVAGCHTCFGGRVIARLQPFSLVEGAEAELSGITRDIARESPPDSLRGTSVRVEPLLEDLIAPSESDWHPLRRGHAGTVVACANIAGLQLACDGAPEGIRVARRTWRQPAATHRAAADREPAARRRRRDCRRVCLALGNSLLASWAPRELPRLNEIGVDARVFALALTTTVLTGLLSGIVPALAASRVDINAVLKRTAGVAGRAAGGRLRNALVVVGLALAFVLILATGLLTRSVLNLQSVEAGFDPHHVLTLTPVVGTSGVWLGRRAHGVLPRACRACAGGAWRRGGRHGEQRPTEPVGAIAPADRWAVSGGRPRQPQRRRVLGLTRVLLGASDSVAARPLAGRARRRPRWSTRRDDQ